MQTCTKFTRKNIHMHHSCNNIYLVIGIMTLLLLGQLLLIISGHVMSWFSIGIYMTYSVPILWNAKTGNITGIIGNLKEW